MTKESKIGICLGAGIKVYPVYQAKDQYKRRVLIYEKDNWYIEVDNNGKLTRYPKSIGTGKILRGKALEGPLEKTYIYWAKHLNDIINLSQL